MNYSSAATFLTDTSSTQYHRCLPGQFTDLLEDETYCRFLWTSKKLPKKVPSWQAIGNSEKQPTTTLLDFKLKCLSEDVFYSPNQFFNWRNSRQLARLNALWVEIDTKSHSILNKEQEQAIIDEVFQQLSKSALPLPNAYVLSGSGGVHLYWIFEEGVEAYKYRVNAWREMAKKLSSKLKGGKLWDVDSAASHDPVRVLRLPGSIHGKSKRIVHAYINKQQKVSFYDMADQCHVEIKKPIYEKGDQKQPLDQKQRIQKAKTSRHTIGQWWAKTYWQVLNFARQQGKERLCSGKKRDLIAFILYVALRHLKSAEDALLELEKINDDLIGLDTCELNAYLQTAVKTKYKFKKDTLAKYIESLGMDSDYLYVQKPKLTPEQIRQRQSAAGANSSTKRRERTLFKLQGILSGNNHITQKKLALIANCSLSTVKRYWPDLDRKVSFAPSSI